MDVCETEQLVVECKAPVPQDPCLADKRENINDATWVKKPGDEWEETDEDNTDITAVNNNRRDKVQPPRLVIDDAAAPHFNSSVVQQETLKFDPPQDCLDGEQCDKVERELYASCSYDELEDGEKYLRGAITKQAPITHTHVVEQEPIMSDCLNGEQCDKVDRELYASCSYDELEDGEKYLGGVITKQAPITLTNVVEQEPVMSSEQIGRCGEVWSASKNCVAQHSGANSHNLTESKIKTSTRIYGNSHGRFMLEGDWDNTHMCGLNKTILLQFLVTAFMGCFTMSEIGAAGVEQVSLTLDIEDSCWFCKSHDPVFVCVVDSVEKVIMWRHDWEIIAIDAIGVVTTDVSLYNVSTQTNHNNTQRRARMQLSRRITEFALNNKSTFVCENQGYKSRPLSLSIPGGSSCQDCLRSTDLTSSDTSISHDDIKSATTDPVSGTSMDIHNDQMSLYRTRPAAATGALMVCALCFGIIVVVSLGIWVCRRRKREKPVDPESDAGVKLNSEYESPQYEDGDCVQTATECVQPFSTCVTT